jgi:hypothetical protein
MMIKGITTGKTQLTQLEPRAALSPPITPSVASATAALPHAAEPP